MADITVQPKVLKDNGEYDNLYFVTEKLVFDLNTTDPQKLALYKSALTNPLYATYEGKEYLKLKHTTESSLLNINFPVLGLKNGDRIKVELCWHYTPNKGSTRFKQPTFTQFILGEDIDIQVSNIYTMMAKQYIIGTWIEFLGTNGIGSLDIFESLLTTLTNGVISVKTSRDSSSTDWEGYSAPYIGRIWKIMESSES